MSLFLFDTPPFFVKEELNRRRIDHGSNYEKPTYSQKPKSPWMRMISGFKPKGEERRILAGGDLSIGQNIEFGFEGLYERRSSTGERYRPEPAITSITVDEQLQSFECTVEWTANSIGQLERLFPYFMNLGTTIIVDWGWDDVDPSVVLDASNKDSFVNQFKRVGADTELDSPPQKNPYDTTKFDRFAKANGRYCFVAGSIVDFSYSPDENGTYSCTTEVMSLSKAMRKLRTQAQEYPREVREENSQQKPYLYEWLNKSFLSHLQEEAENKGDVVTFGQGEVNDDEKLDFAEHGKRKTGYYVSWAEIEEIVNTYGALVKDGETRKNQSESYENPATFTIDSADTIISSFDEGGDPPLNLRTKDPLRCVVDVGVGSDKFRSFTKTPDGAPDLENEKRQGYLYNLYVNYNLIRIAFRTHDTIFDALEYILDECSAACFNIWKFSLEVNGNYIQVVDKNMPAKNNVKGLKDGGMKTFTFKPNTEQTVLRSFNFDTNLDDKMKAQIIAQRTQESDKPSGEPLEGSVFDEIRGENEEDPIDPIKELQFFSVGESSEPKIPAHNARNDSTAKLFGKRYDGEDIVLSPLEKPKNADNASVSESGEGKDSETTSVTFPSWEKLNDTLGEDEVEDRRKTATQHFSGTNASKKYLIYKGRQEGDSKAQEFSAIMQGDTDELSAANANNILGMGAQLELAGISGFTAFQVLDIKQIPKIFENNGVFSIESVSHSVSIDDWSTELKTSFIVGNLINEVK